MTQETDRSPPFYCPECGHKHRADLTTLGGHPGAHARVTCHRCSTTLTLRVDDQGLPVVERVSQGLAGLEDEPARAGPPASAPASLSAPSATGSSGKMGTLLVALLAGALGGFGASQLAPAKEPASPAQAPAPAAGAELSALRTLVTERLQAAEQGSASTEEELRAQLAVQRDETQALRAELKQMAAAPSAPGAHPELETQLRARLEDGLRSLNGRIEANYQAIKALQLQLEAASANK